MQIEMMVSLKEHSEILFKLFLIPLEKILLISLESNLIILIVVVDIRVFVKPVEKKRQFALVDTIIQQNAQDVIYKYFHIEQRSLFRMGFHNVKGLEAHLDDIENHDWYLACNILGMKF